MSFKTLLGGLVDAVPGAQGAILVDWEGEAVDQVARMDDYELKVLGAHKGVILDRLRGAVSRLEGGDPEEVVISTARTRIVIMPVNREYFLVVCLDGAGGLGRALFEARRCMRQLRAEIE